MAFSALFTAALLMLGACSMVSGQTDCVSQFVPCLNDLNSTAPTPSRGCCSAIRQVVSTQLPCLCNLYRNPSLVAGAGINMTQALTLPSRCRVPADARVCNALAPASSPGSSTFPPPVTPGGSGNAAPGLNSWLAMPVVVLVSALTLLLY